MKNKTFKIIICVLSILLIISLHYDVKDEIHLDCNDLGMASIFVSIDTLDVLEALEEKYELTQIREPQRIFEIQNLEIEETKSKCCYPTECGIPCEYNDSNCIYPVRC